MNLENSKRAPGLCFTIKNRDFNAFPHIGTGSFGVWDKDEYNLPVYKLNANTSSEQNLWHLVGNERITATAHSGGYVQVYSWDMGPQILNRFEPQKNYFSGGYSLLLINGHIYSTLPLISSAHGDIQITFGCGYVKKEAIFDGKVFVEERVEAYPGTDTFLHHKISVRNNYSEPLSILLIPIWEPNWYPIDPALIMTSPYNLCWEKLRCFRSKRINKKFSLKTTESEIVLTCNSYSRLYFQRRSSIKVVPISEIFCKNLTSEDLFISFFTSTFKLRDFISSNVKNSATLDSLMLLNRDKLIFSVAYRCLLNPEEDKTAELLFGYRYHNDNSRQRVYGLSDNNKEFNFIYFSSPELNVPVTRELLWHSYYLQAGTVYSSLHDRYYVDQGSAYGYLHGASGAPRDWAFFVIPMIYLKPNLAKEMLLFMSGLQSHRTGKLPYALVGNGKPTGAGVHSFSSDLDLFYLWATFEYLATTFDRELLYIEVPFIDSPKCEIFLDHIKMAFYHLKEKVGIGKHGLIRTGSGDWNDPLLAFSTNPLWTFLYGESTFNTLLAIHILPELASIIVHDDEKFAQELNEFTNCLKENIVKVWNGKWFDRGFVGKGDEVIGGKQYLFLDTQPLGILSDVISGKEKRRLLENIENLCVKDEPFGASSLSPVMKGRFLKPGMDTNGGIWHAINAWLTWAWAKINPNSAWKFFLKSMLFTHADSYPDVWYGIWSGPDAYNSRLSTNPGETFNLNFTPMTDFPIMNMNCHSGILFSLIKLLSIEPSANGISVIPLIPLRKYNFNSQLIDIEKTEENFMFIYKPVCDCSVKLSIRSPFPISLEEQMQLQIGEKILKNFEYSEDTIKIETKLSPFSPLKLLIKK